MITHFNPEHTNILNGECMYKYLSEHGKDMKNCISFNEAMCVGEHIPEIFSEEYIQLRCKSLDTNITNYYNNFFTSLQQQLQKEKPTFTLWFDADMFCQINLLGLLAYLERINCTSQIVFNLTDHYNKFIATYPITLNKYQQLFYKVLVQHQLPTQTLELSLMEKGIMLYLEYIKKENEITEFIQNHKDLAKDKLLYKLFTEFTKYGLGDIQYLQLIDAIKGNS